MPSSLLTRSTEVDMQGHVAITVVLDRSGSMARIRDDMEAGFAEFWGVGGSSK